MQSQKPYLLGGSQNDSKLWFTNKPEQRLQYPGMEHIGGQLLLLQAAHSSLLIPIRSARHSVGLPQNPCDVNSNHSQSLVSCNGIAVYHRNRNKTGGSVWRFWRTARVRGGGDSWLGVVALMSD